MVFLFVMFAFLGCEKTKNAELNNAIKALSEYEKVVLELFFSTLLKESSAGYTLYGEKPLTTQGCQKDTLTSPLDDHFLKNGIILREGGRVWENAKLSKIESKYCIVSAKKLSCYGWFDCNIINTNALHKIISQHLSLFQYILGPYLSADCLVKALQDPHQDLASLFQEDKILNGVVLGYGIKNALHVSREEYISDHLLTGKEEVPKKNSRHRKSFFSSNTECAIKNSKPSFGFSDIKEEQDLLNKECLITSSYDQSDPKLPWFGYIQNHESEFLINGYKKNQKKITQVLQSKNLLETVLQHFFATGIRISTGATNICKLLREKLGAVQNLGYYLGQAVFGELQAVAKTEDIHSFVEGMKCSNMVPFDWEKFYKIMENYDKYEKLLDAKSNLIDAEALLNKIDATILVPDRVCVRIVREGAGQAYMYPKHFVISYTISDCFGNAYCAKDKEEVSIQDLIPGVAMGLRGMKLSEVREIFIHPEWAYGEESNLEPNLGFIAKVKLVEVKSEEIQPEKFTLCALTCMDITKKEIEENYKKYRADMFFALGQKFWQRFNKLNIVALENVIHGMKEMESKNSALTENHVRLVEQLEFLSVLSDKPLSNSIDVLKSF